MRPRTLVPGLLAVCLAALVSSTPAAGATGSIEGTVTDAETGEGLFAASILVTSLRDPGFKVGRLASRKGDFAVGDLPEGSYELRVSYVGYATSVQTVKIAAGEATRVSVALAVEPIPMSKVIVSASRHAEKVLDAPAAVQVIDQKTVEERTVLTPADHLQGRPAIDVVRSGLNQGTVVVRGFNNVFSGATLTLVDNRIARVPSLRYNALNLIPTANEDIQQIEVVSGPGSALYGPNTANGVLHIRTRSPFEYQGTSISVAGGEQDILLASGRHSAAPSETFAYKISAQYYQATDFDPDRSVAELVTDQDLDKVAADGRVDLRPNPDFLVMLNGGFNRLTALEYTGLGPVRAKDWTSGYGQVRARWKKLFWQAYLNFSDAGDTYYLETNNPVKDNSKFFVTQLQHKWNPTGQQTLVYGVDALLTRPNTGGTINGRNEDDDDINEIGGYVQSETYVGERWSLVGAARLDHHNRLDDPVFSPRAAVVFTPASGHKLRATYNRAYSTPTPNNLFLDVQFMRDMGDLGATSHLLGGSEDGFDLWTKGVPEEGFSFRRDAQGGLGGLYMQVPGALGGTGEYLPAVANPAGVWSFALGILQKHALSPIVAPDTSQVGTVLGVPNAATGSVDFVPPEYVQDIDPIKPTITNTFEVGYKGLLGDRVTASVDIWHSRVKDFVGPLRVETPLVLMNPDDLATYLQPHLKTEFLSNGVSPADLADSVEAVIREIASLPSGTVTPENAEDAGDLIMTYRNYGDVDLTGAEVSFEWYPSHRWVLGLNYSYVSKDFFEDKSGISDIALNAPRHKAGAMLSYRNEESGLRASTRVRFVDTFPVLSGWFKGDVEYYTLVDLTAAYDLPFSRGTAISAQVLNLFDEPHQEFPLMPKLRRVGIVRLTQSF